MPKANLRVHGTIKAHTDGPGAVKTMLNKKYFVVPVVAMIEGVRFGANQTSGELGLAKEFGKFVDGWNNRPVVLNHPQVDDSFVSASAPGVMDDYFMGWTQNTSMVDGKLKMQAWLDLSRQTATPNIQETFQRLKSNKRTEISVGFFTDVEETEGEFKGQEYTGIWRNIVPDHLAILHGEIGACSIADGCGAARVNAKKTSGDDSSGGEGGMGGQQPNDADYETDEDYDDSDPDDSDDVDYRSNTDFANRAVSPKADTQEDIDKQVEEYRKTYPDDNEYSEAGQNGAGMGSGDSKVNSKGTKQSKETTGDETDGGGENEEAEDEITSPQTAPKGKSKVLMESVTGAGTMVAGSSKNPKKGKTMPKIIPKVNCACNEPKALSVQELDALRFQAATALGIRVSKIHDSIMSPDVHGAIQCALDAQSSANREAGKPSGYQHVVGFTRKHAITAGWDGNKWGTFRQGLNVDADGNAEFTSPPEEVRLINRIVPVTQTGGSEDDQLGVSDESGWPNEVKPNKQGDKTMPKANTNTKDDKLRNNGPAAGNGYTGPTGSGQPAKGSDGIKGTTPPKTKADEKDDELDGIIDDAMVVRPAAQAKQDDEDEDDMKGNAKKDPKDDKDDDMKKQSKGAPKAQSAQEYIAAAPVEIREMLAASLKVHESHKSSMITALTKSGRCKFTAQKLAAFSIEDLEGLVALADIQPEGTSHSYAGMSGPVPYAQAAGVDESTKAAPLKRVFSEKGSIQALIDANSRKA